MRKPLFAICLSAAAAFGQTVQPPLPPAQEQRLGVFPPFGDILQSSDDNSFCLSRDGRHVAVVADSGKKSIVYSDGRAGAAYDAIDDGTVSPSGGHFAYAARRGARWFVVLDGKEGPPCDGFDGKWDFQPQYAPGGPYESYGVGGVRRQDAALRFSDDGRHFAYVARDGTKDHVMVDGQPGPEFDAIGELAMSADGLHVAYLARRGPSQFAVVDGKAGLGYSGVGPLVLSRNGRHVAYVAYEAKKYFVVADGRPGPPFDFIGKEVLRLSDDGAHVAYAAWVDHDEGVTGLRHVVVADGRAGPEFQGVDPPVFSADARHLAYVAERVIGQKSCVVLDGQPGPEFTAASDVRLSADGSHMAYVARDHQKCFVVFDGRPGPEFDFIAGYYMRTAPAMSPDGRRMAYEARIGVPGRDDHGRPVLIDVKGAKGFIVVDGLPGPSYLGVDQLIFSPDSRHVAYQAFDNEKRIAVLDGKEGAAYRGISSLAFSADSRHLAYVAWKGTGGTDGSRAVVVVDGREGPEFDLVIEDWSRRNDPVAVTPENSLEYLAARAGALYRVIQPLP